MSANRRSFASIARKYTATSIADARLARCTTPSIGTFVWAALRHDRGRVGLPNATLARMAHNPMGTDGFEFVEYTAPDPRALRALFESLGFEQVARHRSKDVVLYRQGEINFIINAEPDSLLAGVRAGAWPFDLRDRAAGEGRGGGLQARARARREPHVGQIGPMELAIPAIKGIGESAIYLVDRYGDRTSTTSTSCRSRPRAHHGRRHRVRCSRSPKVSGSSTSITSRTTSSAATWRCGPSSTSASSTSARSATSTSTAS